jgi:ankyrin repeat protein
MASGFRRVLSKGAIVDEISTEKQWTPLLFATYPKRVDKWIPYPEQQGEVVQLLLAHGANVQVTAPDGRTVLHNTARNGDTDLVRTVVEYGADVRAVMSDGTTALHLVCDLSNASVSKMTERLAIIQILLDHGANVNARDQTGSTPLHASWSCAKYSTCFGPDPFNLLLKKSADRSATNKDMKTPVDLLDTTKWMWDEDGLVREKPKPKPPKVIYNWTRGGRGRRGTQGWMRGPSRGN